MIIFRLVPSWLQRQKMARTAQTTENSSNDRKWLKLQKKAQTTENGSNDIKWLKRQKMA
jgi:hypothetical protein